ADFDPGQPLDVHGRQPHLDRGFKDFRTRRRAAVPPGACHFHVRAPCQPPRLLRQLMDVDMLINLDDIVRPHLRGEDGGNERTETLVEIVPGVILFQVRIHPGKRRRHGVLPGSAPLYASKMPAPNWLTSSAAAAACGFVAAVSPSTTSAA